MTSESDFQAALDASPSDWQTRLVFADWLQERGDERAEGYRALGMLRRYPGCDMVNEGYELDSSRIENRIHFFYGKEITVPKRDKEWLRKYGHRLLPIRWFEHLQPNTAYGGLNSNYWKCHSTRLEAEEAAVQAFLKLNSISRAEILSKAK